MNLLNFTPHDIILRLPNGEDILLHSSGEARVSIEPSNRVVCGLPIPVYGPDIFGEIVGLPEGGELCRPCEGLAVGKPPMLAVGKGEVQVRDMADRLFCGV